MTKSGVKRPSLAERQAERRERLIRAAVATYGERGYARASVKAVCEAAGLTERYFYESFANSEALLVAASSAVTWLLVDDMKRAGAAHADAASEVRLRAMLDAFFDRMEVDPRATRVFLVEIVGVSAAAAEVLTAVVERVGRLLAEALGSDTAPPLLRTGVAGGLLQMAYRMVRLEGDETPVLRRDLVENAMRLCGVLGHGSG